MNTYKALSKELRKNPDSAAVTARLVSKVLRKSGFDKADTRVRHHWTEGYLVHRAGGDKVRVNWHVPHTYDNGDLDRRVRRHSMLGQMREALFECGYVSTHKPEIYIQCQRP